MVLMVNQMSTDSEGEEWKERKSESNDVLATIPGGDVDGLELTQTHENASEQYKQPEGTLDHDLGCVSTEKKPNEEEEEKVRTSTGGAWNACSEETM